MNYQIITFSLTDSHRYGNALEKLLCLRCKGFIQEGGYQDIYNYNGLDFDQYDNPFAQYMLILQNEKAIACARLNRTDFNHKIGNTHITYMAKDVWAKQIESASLPINSNTYELTRLYVCSSLERSEQGRVFYLLVSALYVHSVSLNIKKWVFVTSKSVLNVNKKLGIEISHTQNLEVENFQNQVFACAEISQNRVELILQALHGRTSFNLLQFAQSYGLLKESEIQQAA